MFWVQTSRVERATKLDQATSGPSTGRGVVLRLSTNDAFQQ